MSLAAAGLAVGLAAPLLALAVPAGAVTGPAQASAGQTGFVAAGAQFRDVPGQVFGRNGAGFAATQTGIGGSLSLWAGGGRGTVVLVGISTGTGSARGGRRHARLAVQRGHRLPYGAHPVTAGASTEDGSS